MRCHEVEGLLMRYIDGRLAAELAGKLDTHLEVCPRCRRSYEDEVELVAAFHTDGLRPAGAPLVQAVMRDIDDLEAARQRAHSAPLRIRPSAAVAVAAAAAAALLALWHSGWLERIGGAAGAQGGLLGWKLGGAGATVERWAAWARASVAEASGTIDYVLGLATAVGATISRQHLTLVGVLTVAAALACVALVGAFRHQPLEEDHP